MSDYTDELGEEVDSSLEPPKPRRVSFNIEGIDETNENEQMLPNSPLSLQWNKEQEPVPKTPKTPQQMFGTPVGKSFAWSNQKHVMSEKFERYHEMPRRLTSSGSVPLLVNRPTPDRRAFTTSHQLKRKFPVSMRKSRTSSAQLRPSPSCRCPPTPVRSVPRDKRNTPNRKDKILCEPQVLFNSPFREFRLKDALPSLIRMEKIGEGTSSEVYRVKNKEDDKFYAVKKYKKQFKSENDRNKAKKEASIWINIPQCQYIVSLYRAWQEDGYMHFLTELCDGGSLKYYTETIASNAQHNVLASASTQERENSQAFAAQKGDMSPSSIGSRASAQPPYSNSFEAGLSEMQIWRLLHDCCSALARIHDLGFVHNDVKPSNFYLGVGPEGMGYRVLLGDFGQITKIGEFEDANEGDFVYLANEVLEHGKSEPSADMFSLGISFYEIAGEIELPEGGEMWHALRNGRVPAFLNNRSDTLYKLICALLDKNPSQRPSAKDILQVPEVASAASVTLDILPGSEFRNSNYTQEVGVQENLFNTDNLEFEGLEEDDEEESSEVSPALKSAKGDLSLFNGAYHESQYRNDVLNDPTSFEEPSLSQAKISNSSPRRRLYDDFDRLDIEGAFATSRGACRSTHIGDQTNDSTVK